LPCRIFAPGARFRQSWPPAKIHRKDAENPEKKEQIGMSFFLGVFVCVLQVSAVDLFGMRPMRVEKLEGKWLGCNDGIVREPPFP
jgi:hypothetical protein